MWLKRFTICLFFVNVENCASVLQEIQCYICQKHGHLCCAEFAHSNTTEVSCYNCAQAGHAGSVSRMDHFISVYKKA